jgi:hypothetical protein
MECVLKTKGPILEIGSGFYSTPFLCFFNNDRLVVSVESDEKWREQSQDWGVIALPSVDEALRLSPNYDVVLIDGPIKSRQPNVELFRKRARFVIVHDTEDDVYGYKFDGWKYKKWFKELQPWTTLLSQEPL